MPCFRPNTNNPFKATNFVGLIPVQGMYRTRAASKEPNQPVEILERAPLPGFRRDARAQGREQFVDLRLLGIQAQGLLQVPDRAPRVPARDQ